MPPECHRLTVMSDRQHKHNNQVLIAGAGPVGLICALRLSQAGIPVVVFEQERELLDDPRAATTHPGHTRDAE